MSDVLRIHAVVLHGPRVTLRPLTENDWPFIIRLWNDDAVAEWADGNGPGDDSSETIQAIYRRLSREAFQFIIEEGGRPIGDCHLQRMNLPAVAARYPGRDLRRIDIAIGEPPLWGTGRGSEAIRLLTRFGFEHERADFIFGCDIGYENPRSLLAFAKAGYELEDGNGWLAGSRTGDALHAACSRPMWERFHAGDRPLVIRPAQPGERDEVVSILVEAGRWLISRGIKQWESLPAQVDQLARTVEGWIQAGEMFVAHMDDVAAGTFRLGSPAPWDVQVWPDATPREHYVAKLAIRRSFAGRGLGVRLLRRAEVLAVARGATMIRLDCVADGPLAAYYARAGYTPCGVVEAHGGWRLARFERRLAG